MRSVKILLCVHKESPLPLSDLYLPIHVGKSISNVGLNFIGDDEGENISSKNPNYCELTALYWAWKNLNNAEIIGLCHYRRYFEFSKSPKNITLYHKPLSEIDSLKFNSAVVEKTIDGYDIVLARPNNFPVSLCVHYCLCHVDEDLAILSKVLRTYHSEYYPAFERIMSGNEISPYNMFIMRKDLMGKYCEWLFDVLFKVEEYVRLSPYARQSRVFGYMSERLLKVFCEHHNLKIKYLPVAYLDDKLQEKKQFKLNTFKNNLRHKFSSGTFKRVYSPYQFDSILQVNGIKIK